MATVIYGGKNVSDSTVRDVLQRIADYFQANVEVTSGDRTTVPDGGSPTSRHLVGRAADFKVDGLDYGIIYLNLRNIGYQQVFVGGHGYEFIWHGPHTATTGQHLHLDRVGANQNGYVNFIQEGITAQGRDKYPLDIKQTLPKMGIIEQIKNILPTF